MVLDSADTLEDPRALVFPWIEAAATRKLRARAKSTAAKKREAMRQAHAQRYVLVPDPGVPKVTLVIREDKATPEERALDLL